jgi:hypothetical protein
MRLRVFALLAAAVCLALTPIAAEAGHRRAPRGYGEVQVVHHYGYYPRYRNVYNRDFYTDPYAYRASPRGYYPYYNSGYWRPTAELRYRRACCRPYSALPPYYQAWGYPKRVYYKNNGRRYHRHW